MESSQFRPKRSAVPERRLEARVGYRLYLQRPPRQGDRAEQEALCLEYFRLSRWPGREE
jgi:hypothetical protein